MAIFLATYQPLGKPTVTGTRSFSAEPARSTETLVGPQHHPKQKQALCCVHVRIGLASLETKDLVYCLVSFPCSVSGSPGWPWTRYIAEDDFALLILLHAWFTWYWVWNAGLCVC